MCRREVIFGWHPMRGAEIGLLDENLASENQARKDRSTILGCRFSHVSNISATCENRWRNDRKSREIEQRKWRGKRAFKHLFLSTREWVVEPVPDQFMWLHGRGTRRTYSLSIDKTPGRAQRRRAGRVTHRRENELLPSIAVIEIETKRTVRKFQLSLSVEYIAPEKPMDSSFLLQKREANNHPPLPLSFVRRTF